MVHDNSSEFVVLCFFFRKDDLLSARLEVLFQIFDQLRILGGNRVSHFRLLDSEFREVHGHQVFHHFGNDKRERAPFSLMEGAVHTYFVLVFFVGLFILFLYEPCLWET